MEQQNQQKLRFFQNTILNADLYSNYPHILSLILFLRQFQGLLIHLFLCIQIKTTRNLNLKEEKFTIYKILKFQIYKFFIIFEFNKSKILSGQYLNIQKLF
ncbi:hypothetical protein BpHYR1_030786 [Brachionus plicatilis]|uniref:Uncharacterized protein n=1 Tax=Brachionus plicatilis TaxID=10195 RepID=A0A3M7RJP3_BRAPC|nr:hypothetical protein BpHYR1_030786 [Brachionus plicatilis]